MDQKEGYQYAKDFGIISGEDNFFKGYFILFKVKELNLGEKTLLSLVLSYTNRRMEFYMSNNIISEVLGISRKSVINLIGSLKDKNLIETVLEDTGAGVPKRYIKINKRMYNNLIRKYNGTTN